MHIKQNSGLDFDSLNIRLNYSQGHFIVAKVQGNDQEYKLRGTVSDQKLKVNYYLIPFCV